MTVDAKTLLKEINDRFNRMKYPGEDHIVLDTPGIDLERQEIKNLLKDTTGLIFLSLC